MKLLTNVIITKFLRNYNNSHCNLIGKCRHLSAQTQNFSAIENVSETVASLTDDILDGIEQNIELRQTKNNVTIIRDLLRQLRENNVDSTSAASLHTKLQAELQSLPNATHPRLVNYGNEPRELFNYVLCEPATQNPKEFSQICRSLNLLRMDHLGNYTGHKSYYLLGQLAELEQALIDYALKTVRPHGFKLISVPDILPQEIIESCGMRADGERTQVYKLDAAGLCLSGTSEMALAGYFANQLLDESELPLKVTAVSRCYRAETSGLNEEKGIYRVHQFTKVEMFAVCAQHQSENELEEFKNIEVSLFKNLGLNFRLLDMPPYELGAPAYHKYDIEAWLPGRKMWGEISSCSNCTDYQAKRLNIRYRSVKDGRVRFAHTINGTATAIPRLLLALMETNQNSQGDAVSIPDVLVPYMGSNKLIKNKKIPETKLVKFIKTAAVEY